MPPRFAYWTILIDNGPTAFRARDQEDLLPTLTQLRRTNPNVVMKWFARGKLWDSPEQAQWSAKNLSKRDGPARERRGQEWRPGGEHKDPRDRFKKKGQRKDPRAQFAKRPDDQPRRDGAAPPNRPDAAQTRRPARPYGDRPKKPYGDRPAKAYGDRPWRGNPRSDRPQTALKPDGPPRPLPTGPARKILDGAPRPLPVGPVRKEDPRPPPTGPVKNRRRDFDRKRPPPKRR